MSMSSNRFMFKISSSGTPKCLNYAVTITLYTKLKLPSRVYKEKTKKVMVAKVVYFLERCARTLLGCTGVDPEFSQGGLMAHDREGAGVEAFAITTAYVSYAGVS